MSSRIETRRDLIRKSAFLGLGAGLLPVVGGRADAACLPTAAQTEGPFYPVRDQADKDWDLTQIRGNARAARGEAIEIHGRILDRHCQPVSGALVEIWQACDTGRYNHPRDPNPAALDPDFQYWGRYLTKESGKYTFRSIIPGAYPANASWQRPPHIHFKVSAPGVRTFVTQMYFAGQPLNDDDLILQALTPAQRNAVIVDFSGFNVHLGASLGFFDITLNFEQDLTLTPELD